MFKLHDLDKTITQQRESSTSTVLQHFEDFLQGNQCRTFNLNGTLTLEKIRELNIWYELLPDRIMQKH